MLMLHWQLMKWNQYSLRQADGNFSKKVIIEIKKEVCKWSYGETKRMLIKNDHGKPISTGS